MATEETPLRADDQQLINGNCYSGDVDERDVYARFSRAEKRIIVTLVSLAGLVPLFVGGSFVPSIPQIAEDLQASGAVVSLAVSLSVFANASGGLVWSGYASVYGRRPVSLWGMPLMVLGSFGSAYSANVIALLFWRFIQAFGCSGGMSIGAAVIGDIYRLEERGSAMGSFFGVSVGQIITSICCTSSLQASLFGLAVAPLAGGTAAEYWSWRGFQVALGIWGLIQIGLMYWFLPETAHPGTRGIDRLKDEASRKRLVLVNPFQSLGMLRSPILILVTVANTFALSTDYVLLVPIAYTLGIQYNIKSETLIGACFLPNGLGNIFGAYISGRLSDILVKKWRAKRNGVWYPEDRLRGVYIGALYLIPLSVSLAGLTMAYVGGTSGLAITLICLFTNGVGVDMVLTPNGSYIVDLMGVQSAEAMAALTALRSLLLAPLSALIVPSIELLGIVATNVFAALLALIGYSFFWLTIRYGNQMRAYVDVGYATIERAR
ncbi:major facilitator superfamily domain-containing protein [Pisolithus albus]|nr:major facilitator superfamily domain-containing protein [Pisolithus albus]